MDNEEKGVKIASSIIILERVRSTLSGVSKVSDTNLGWVHENFHFPWFLSLIIKLLLKRNLPCQPQWACFHLFWEREEEAG